MSGLADFAAGALGGVTAYALAAVVQKRVRRARWAWLTDTDRWSAVDATRVERRLNRRLGRPYPRRIASDPAVYAAWRRDLEVAAFKRLLQDFKLVLHGRSGERLLVWGQITVPERRLILGGVRHHFRQLVLGKLGQKQADQGAQGDGVAGLNRLDVVDVDHSDLSDGGFGKPIGEGVAGTVTRRSGDHAAGGRS